MKTVADMTYEERSRILSASEEDFSRMIHLDFQKATGHGGQKINKTSSSFRALHLSSGISVRCMESRSQLANRKIACQKLRREIARQIRIPLDQYPLEKRLFHLEPVPSAGNTRYPCWIADFFDVLFSCSADLHQSAELLQTSPSKLSKLLKKDPSLWRDFLILRAQCSPGENRQEDHNITLDNTPSSQQSAK